jgi:hypothetical protein
MTIVCGDSHTATHGAFGALAFGIGTSEVEHVLATQTLLQKPAKNMRITCNGKLPHGVDAKDLVLHIIGTIGTAGGTLFPTNAHAIVSLVARREVRAARRPSADTLKAAVEVGESGESGEAAHAPPRTASK